MRSTRAFTLVELLATLVILAVLAALSFPAVGYALERSRNTRCLSNLRQIGLALNAYASDHGQQLPDLVAGRRSLEENLPVMDTVLLPYAGNMEVFRCPGDRQKLFEQTGSSYFWNYLPVLQEDGSKNLLLPSLQFPLTGATEPSKIPLVVDKESFHRGGKQSNLLYADGSVRASR
jgi:prepilin-type N-terminal cleavage/methylation domain-containing protein/prepilin-type processing-associated H-X9-DG protein